MTPKPPKSVKKDLKLYIRVSDPETIRGFKRIAADFKNYEDVLKWFNNNYSTFTKIVPPRPIPGGLL
jgi:hypothetical protein